MYSEASIERRLKKEVEKIGGKALKFVSPGTAGVPDRMVLLPGGRMFFVELKAPGKELRALQQLRKKQLEKLEFKVLVIDTVEKIQQFIEEVVL